MTNPILENGLKIQINDTDYLTVREILRIIKEYGHPTARCPEATRLYFEWAKHKKGTADYEKACLAYKWHIANCERCKDD